MKPSNRIKTEWSANLAYVVGLITTDGCLYNDGRHIDFTSQDVQLIKTFKKCLKIDNKIGFKKNGYSEKKYPHIQFGDVNFYNWLVSIGITAQKSKTIASLKIPKRFFFDFLRGHFDGDGSCYCYWDKRWVSSFMFYLYFYSASENHIKWLQTKIKESSGVAGKIGKNEEDGVYRLKFAKKEGKILISKMYYREKLPCLQRKFKKINKILKIEEKEDCN